MKTFKSRVLTKIHFFILMVLLATVLVTKVHAQSLSFVHTFNSPQLDEPGEMRLSSQGNLFVTGRFSHDSIVIGNVVVHSPIQNRINTFVAKLDTAGNCYWAQVVSSDSNYNNPPSIALDTNENVYLASFFSEETDVDPGSNIQNLTPAAGYRSMLLVKYNTNGVFDWGFQITDSMSFPNTLYIDVDKNQDVVLAGTFSSLTDFDPSPMSDFYLQASIEVMREAFVAKYTSSGQFIQAFRLVEQNYGLAEILDMTTDSQNNILLTGYIVGSVDMDPNAVTTNLLISNGSWDYFLTKYNSQGDLLWTFNVGSFANEAGNFVYTDDTDSIFVGGIMRSNSTDFDHSLTSTALLTTHGEADVFYGKYSPEGDLAFIENIGGAENEYLSGMGKDPFNYLYWAISYWSNNWDCDFSSGLNNVSSIGSGDDLIMRTNSNGNLDFAFNIGTIYTDNFTRGIASIDNGFFLYGWYNGSMADFDPSSGVAFPSFYGGADITLAKYYFEWENHVSLNELLNNLENVIVYPNPVGGDVLTIRNVPEGSGLYLCDLYGNTLISQEIIGEAELTGMSALTSGLYLLRIECINGAYSVRVIVE